ncbi:MAG: primosomal protein N' [Paracoccaceae bacterium]
MTDFFDQGELVAVLTTQPLDTPLDYYAPQGGCRLGAFVTVPLGPRIVIGVVWGRGEGGYEASKIRTIHNVIDVAPMREELRSFLIKASAYTLTPLSAMLRLATRAPGLANPPSMQSVYRRTGTSPDRETEARKRVLALFEDYGGGPFTKREIAQLAGVSDSVVSGLEAQQVLQKIETPKDRPFPAFDLTRQGKKLTSQQVFARDEMTRLNAQEGFDAILLHGVTGSGKTEVYLEAVADQISKGGQVLVLLPEIALTSEFIQRVEARFGQKPAEWHSGVTMTERRRIWKMVGQGGAQLVVGARSALFLPFQSLRLIVVDEEHDPSYKQEDGVLYNARDMAVLRASLAGSKIILASATPSLESWSNAKSGKYNLITLADRFGKSQLPDLSVIDMRTEKLPSNRWISTVLQRHIAQRIERNEQSLLFLNRRGYAPTTLCRACGHQVGCEHCDARMVEHRFQKRLMCHQCGETKAIPEACPACGVEGKLAVVGPGVERLAEEAAALFPDAQTSILSSDLFSSARALKDKIKEIAEGQSDIIIGTQLVAKGHNFPRLTLVGVIDTDLGLHGSDLRASERTFQLVQQVAGRAGRKETKGLALLQTHQPDHPVIQAILRGNDEAFWTAEAEGRQGAEMPPFGRLAGIIISATNQEDAFDLGNALARNTEMLRRSEISVFGPASAPIARVRGRFRVRLLLKAAKSAPMQQAIAQWLKTVKPRKDVRLSVDIDPQSFL